MAALTRTIAGVDVADVEGWLTKKKQRKALNALTGAATRRWFCVARVSPPIIEDLHSQQQLWRDPCRSVLALCYYASREASESPRGWIYLADVRGLRAVDDAALAIEYPKRTYVLVAPDGPRRDRWVKGLAQIASHARTAEGAAAALPPLAAPGLASPADDPDSVFSPCGRRASRPATGATTASRTTSPGGGAARATTATTTGSRPSTSSSAGLATATATSAGVATATATATETTTATTTAMPSPPKSMPS